MPEQAVVGRLPDFFLAGHAKCGTTALYEMLRRHPQIYMPQLKEPYFFATEFDDRRATARSGALPETLSQYSALFADAAPTQICGEASAYYLWSKDAARRIAELCPAARVIAIFREPVSFIRSLHLQFLQDHHEDEKSLRRAIDLEPARQEGKRMPRSARWPKLLQYSEHVKYAEQLMRFRTYFPAERVLVVIYDDLRSDNDDVVQTILRFLEVDDRSPIATIEANPTVRVRSQRLDDLVHLVSVGRGGIYRPIKMGVKTMVPRRIRRRALRTAQHSLITASPHRLDESLALELRRRYAPEVAALSECLDRDLMALWGYDYLG